MTFRIPFFLFPSPFISSIHFFVFPEYELFQRDEWSNIVLWISPPVIESNILYLVRRLFTVAGSELQLCHIYTYRIFLTKRDIPKISYTPWRCAQPHYF